MGCDIHLYPEWIEKNSAYPNGEWVHSLGQLHVGRNYNIFCLIAGVRDYGEVPVLYQPRGLPENVGYLASSDNTLYVVEDEKYKEGEGYTKRSLAEKWVAQGSSKWTDQGHKFVTHPDWHSHSWLSTEELRIALDTYKRETGFGYPKIWESVYALVNSFGNEGRIVFWFDN